MSDKNPISNNIHRNVLNHRIKTGKYPEKLYVGVDVYSDLVCEATCDNCLIDTIERKFMNITVVIVEESGHISFDASGVDKNQFVEAPLYLIN